MRIMNKLTFGISPHISAIIKPINPLTDKRHNRSTNFCGGSVLPVVDVVLACSFSKRKDRKDQR